MSAGRLDRVAAARRRVFVGREAELELFRSVLRRSEAGGAGAVLRVHGPAGIGKSTLLRHYGLLAEAARRPVVWLDGRDLRAAPAAGPAAAGPAAAEVQRLDGGPLARLGELPCAVLLVDDVEPGGPVDGWLHDELLPRLRADATVVLAGRGPAPVAWRVDPSRRGVRHSVPLGGLHRAHAAELLRLCGVPAALHGRAMALTRGNPLALALLADVYAQSRPLPSDVLQPPADVLALLAGGYAPPSEVYAQPAGVYAQPAEVCAQPAATSGVLGVLLDGLVTSAATPAHLCALVATSQVLVTTEPLLACLLDADDAREPFGWLRDLSITDHAPRGLVPHELVRETLATELRRRHPDVYAAVRDRAQVHYQRQLADADADATARVLVELVFLHRDAPVLGRYLRHVEPGREPSRLTVTGVGDGEWPALARIVGLHEGPESAELASHWHRCQPEAVAVVRHATAGPVGSATGLLIMPALGAATAGERDADPATAAVWRYLTQRRLPADGTLLMRHWMSAADHQAISEVGTFITLHLIRLCLETPGTTQAFVTCADPEYSTAAFEYVGFHRLPGADFEVGGRRYGMFGHDWRAVPPPAWITVMAGRTEVGPDTGFGQHGDGAPDAALTEPEFADAVRAALRDLTRLDRLDGAVLGRSCLVCAPLPTTATATERARAIREVVRSAATVLEASPRDRKLFRVLHHTFLQPAETQARAAELLDLPTSTYRRHLTAGVARLTEILWQRELDARK